jgi:hypothetical protein
LVNPRLVASVLTDCPARVRRKWMVLWIAGDFRVRREATRCCGIGSVDSPCRRPGAAIGVEEIPRDPSPSGVNGTGAVVSLFCPSVDLNFEFGLARRCTVDVQLLFALPETHAEDSALRVNFVSCSDELEPVIFVALLCPGWSTDILKRGDSLICSHQLDFWEGGSWLRRSPHAAGTWMGIGPSVKECRPLDYMCLCT